MPPKDNLYLCITSIFSGFTENEVYEHMWTERRPDGNCGMKNKSGGNLTIKNTFLNNPEYFTKLGKVDLVLNPDVELYQEWLDAMGTGCEHIDHAGNCQSHFVEPAEECLYKRTQERIKALTEKK